MSVAMKEVIPEKSEQLSPPPQAEVSKFIENLLQKEQAPPTRGLKFDWCAGPDEPPVEMTSVEMQHEVLEWMAQKAEEHLTKQ
jgi:hypothetical protein